MATVTQPESPTVLDLGSLADDALYEIIDGQIVEILDMGHYPVKIANVLGRRLGVYVEDNNLGEAFVEALYRLDDDNQRRPDVSYVSFERWAKGRSTPVVGPFDVIPDLAVEVVSKSDQAWEVLAKTHFYLQAGVRLVWVIYPIQAVVYAYTSFTSPHVFSRSDVLDGGEVVPGFRLPLDTLFEPDEPLP